MGSYRLAPAFRWQNAVEGDIMRIRLRPVRLSDINVVFRRCMDHLMESKEELFVFTSPDIEAIFTENETNLADLLKREGCDVEQGFGKDLAKASSGDSTREIATTILASAALVAALTPIVLKVLQSLTYKDVVVHEVVLVPVEDSDGNVIKDASGEPVMNWIKRSKILESTRDQNQQEINIKALGFEIEIRSSGSQEIRNA